MKTPGAHTLMIGLVALGLLGCATIPEELPIVKPLRGDDLKTLAGLWEGTYSPPEGRTVPVTLQINADRTYEARGDTFTGRGALQTKDDKLVLIPRYTGDAAAPIQSTATLLVSTDGSRVLSGSGYGETGPFSFELRNYEVRKKK